MKERLTSELVKKIKTSLNEDVPLDDIEDAFDRYKKNIDQLAAIDGHELAKVFMYITSLIKVLLCSIDNLDQKCFEDIVERIIIYLEITNDGNDPVNYFKERKND